MCLGWWSEISEKLARVCTGPSSASRSSADSSGFLTSWITRRDRRGWMDLVGIGESFGESDSANVGSSNLECAFGPMTSSVFRDCERFPCLETLEWSREDGRYLVCSTHTIMSQSKSSFKRKLKCFPGMIQAQSKGSIDWKRIWRCSPSLVTRLQSLQSVWIPNSSNTSNFWIFRLKRAA